MGPEGMTLATVLNFHAVPELMDEGEGYATLAGADQGKLTINGDAVEGPCNTGNVVTTVDVCGSIVHVIDQVLLPGAACGKDDHDDEDHDHDDEDHDHDDEDHSEEDGGDEDEDDAEDDAAEDDDGGVLGGVLGDDGGVLGDDGGVEGEAEALFDAADDATEDAAAPAPTDLVGEAYRPDQNYQAEIESLEGDGTEADDTLQDIQQNNENNDNNSGAPWTMLSILRSWRRRPHRPRPPLRRTPPRKIWTTMWRTKVSATRSTNSSAADKLLRPRATPRTFPVRALSLCLIP